MLVAWESDDQLSGLILERERERERERENEKEIERERERERGQWSVYYTNT